MSFKLSKESAHQVIARERLYLTADRKRVVREGDKAAAFLFAAIGASIAVGDARKFGLLDDVAPGVEPEARSTRPARPSVTR